MIITELTGCLYGFTALWIYWNVFGIIHKFFSQLTILLSVFFRKCEELSQFCSQISWFLSQFLSQYSGFPCIFNQHANKSILLMFPKGWLSEKYVDSVG